MRIVYNIAIELVLFGALFGTFALGNEGAHNLFSFMVWFFAITGMILAVAKEGKKSLREQRRSDTRIAYFATRNIIIVGACAWLGMPALATIFAITCLLMHSARTSKEPEAA